MSSLAPTLTPLYTVDDHRHFYVHDKGPLHLWVPNLRVDMVSELEYLTIAQASDRFKVSEKTVRRWIKSGKLSADLREGTNGPQYYVLGQIIEAKGTVVSETTQSSLPTEEQIQALLSRVVSDVQTPVLEELRALRADIQVLLERTAPKPELPPPAPTRRHWWDWLVWGRS